MVDDRSDALPFPHLPPTAVEECAALTVAALTPLAEADCTTLAGDMTWAFRDTLDHIANTLLFYGDRAPFTPPAWPMRATTSRSPVKRSCCTPETSPPRSSPSSTRPTTSAAASPLVPSRVARKARTSMGRTPCAGVPGAWRCQTARNSTRTGGTGCRRWRSGAASSAILVRLRPTGRDAAQGRPATVLDLVVADALDAQWRLLQ